MANPPATLVPSLPAPRRRSLLIACCLARPLAAIGAWLAWGRGTSVVRHGWVLSKDD